MRKKTATDLLDSLNIEITIECSRCDKKDSVLPVDHFDAADSFFKDGWRATATMAYCPECAKKYLKSDKK